MFLISTKPAQALSELIKVPVTEDNYRLIQSYVELIGLPMRGDICDSLERKFSQNKEDEMMKDMKEELYGNKIPGPQELI
jgi:hypothetical protein